MNTPLASTLHPRGPAAPRAPGPEQVAFTEACGRPSCRSRERAMLGPRGIRQCQGHKDAREAIDHAVPLALICVLLLFVSECGRTSGCNVRESVRMGSNQMLKLVFFFFCSVFKPWAKINLLFLVALCLRWLR